VVADDTLPSTTEATMTTISDPATDLATITEEYLRAVGEKRFDRVSELLHPDVDVELPGRTMRGAAAYIASFQRIAPIILRNDIKKVVASGDDVCVVYDFVTSTSVGAVPSAEWLTFEDGRIRSIRLIFHSLPWPKVLEELAARQAP
jgi:ketosteroid isomerase-like protein